MSANRTLGILLWPSFQNAASIHPSRRSRIIPMSSRDAATLSAAERLKAILARRSQPSVAHANAKPPATTVPVASAAKDVSLVTHRYTQPDAIWAALQTDSVQLGAHDWVPTDHLNDTEVQAYLTPIFGLCLTRLQSNRAVGKSLVAAWSIFVARYTAPALRADGSRVWARGESAHETTRQALYFIPRRQPFSRLAPPSSGGSP